MRPRPVEQIRRLALAALVVVTLVIVGSYGVRRWRAHQARQQVSAPMPSDVQQRAEKFTFSRSEEGRTLFTVQASRTIERAGQATVLEDVVVHIYGRRGERADEIRTGRCEYDVAGTGRIRCPGQVIVHLGSGKTPQASAPSLELITTALQFDPAQGVAWTEQPVHFSFPEGAGEAVGLRYQPREPRVRLQDKVTLRVHRGEREPVRICGSQLHYYAAAQRFDLVPPLQLQSENRTLTANRLRMALDANFRTRWIEASGEVQARGQQDGRKLTMRADRAVALYGSDGRIQQLRARGRVQFTGRRGDSEERLTCAEAVFDFDASHRSIRQIAARGAARLVVQTPEETRTLTAPLLELVLGSSGRSQQFLTARQRGTLEVRQPGGIERTLVADRIRLEFGERGSLQSLAAAGAVETRTVQPGGTERATSSDQFKARFDADGRLAEAEQWGSFHYKDARWHAQAGRGHYRSDTGVFVLREHPAIWDASTHTIARVIEVAEKTGVVRARGEVRTTQRASAADQRGFGSNEPLQLAADRMRAEQNRGWARYEGRARLWQGKNRLAADALELFRQPEKLVAEHNVSGLFFEVADGKKEEITQAPRRRAVRVTSERFIYWAAERRGVFDGGVTAQNDFGTLTAPHLEVFLSPSADGGAQSVEKVYAEGGVRIEQKGWHATSRKAEYRAEAQTVVLWGGPPTIFHPGRGTTTGARLTLVIPDDRILIDSAEGARTVTRRPWTQ